MSYQRPKVGPIYTEKNGPDKLQHATKNLRNKSKESNTKWNKETNIKQKTQTDKSIHAQQEKGF